MLASFNKVLEGMGDARRNPTVRAERVSGSHQSMQEFMELINEDWPWPPGEYHQAEKELLCRFIVVERNRNTSVCKSLHCFAVLRLEFRAVPHGS